MIKHNPKEPEYWSIAIGEMKIPEPIMVLMMRLLAEKSPISLFSFTGSSIFKHNKICSRLNCVSVAFEMLSRFISCWVKSDTKYVVGGCLLSSFLKTMCSYLGWHNQMLKYTYLPEILLRCSSLLRKPSKAYLLLIITVIATIINNKAFKMR